MVCYNDMAYKNRAGKIIGLAGSVWQNKINKEKKFPFFLFVVAAVYGGRKSLITVIVVGVHRTLPVRSVHSHVRTHMLR